MVMFFGSLVGQLIDPLTLIATVIAGFFCARPPALYVALILGGVAKALLLALLNPDGVARYPITLLAAFVAGVVGVAIGAGLVWLLERARAKS